MADNITLNAGTGGVTLKTDEDASGYHWQLIKLGDGTADSTTLIQAGAGLEANALRVTLPTDGTGVVKLGSGSATVGTFNLGTWATVSATSPATLEDTASAAGEMILKVGMIRNDTTPATTTGADGDWEGIQGYSGCVWVMPYGNVAHDAADAGNPIKIGAKAKASDGTDPGSVAENDRTDLYADLNGRQYVSTVHPRLGTANDNESSAQTNTELVAAPGAGLSIYVTDVVISSVGAQTTKLVEDGGGTPVDKVPIIYTGTASETAAMHFNQPIRLTANKNLAWTSTAAVATSVLVNYYIAP